MLLLHLDPNAPLDMAAHAVPLLAGAGGTLIPLILAALRGDRRKP